MFISSRCLFLSEPSACKLFTQWGIQKLLILLGQFSKFPMPLAHHPLYALDPELFFCCYDNEMCSITMTKLSVFLWMMDDLCEFTLFYIFLHQFTLLSTIWKISHFAFHDHKPDSSVPSSVKH